MLCGQCLSRRPQLRTALFTIYLHRPAHLNSRPPHFSLRWYSFTANMSSLKRKPDTLTSSPSDAKKPKKDSTLTSFFGAPKIVSSTKPKSNNSPSSSPSSSAPAKFDKAKWVQSLSAEQKSLLKLEIDTLDSSWLAHLKDEILSSDFLSLKRFLAAEITSGKKIFPPLEEVYSWSRHTPLNTVRVVILGQDPYHNHNQAHGLCFSVRPPTPAPPSLGNIYKALKNDYPDFQPPPNRGGLLTPWADQGVLLLNTCLTVRAHDANSHSNKGWERFTQKVIDTVVKVRTRGVVFLAWGTPAQKRCAKISGGKHVVLKSVHPSPLSAAKGFYDCGHFKKTNDWLEERYGEEGKINWDLNVKTKILGPEAVGKSNDSVALIGDYEPGKAGGEDDNSNAWSGGWKKKPSAPATKPTTSNNNQSNKEEKPAASTKAATTSANDEFEFDEEEDEDAIAAMEEMARDGVGDDSAPNTQPEEKEDDGTSDLKDEEANKSEVKDDKAEKEKEKGEDDKENKSD